jgi:molybdopterin molybdotransferase
MPRLKGFAKLINVDEALSILLNTIKLRRPEPTSVPIEEASGRVITADILAPFDLPPFDRSAVDGYAVRARDTFEASTFKPKILQLTSEDNIRKGLAKIIWTGNPLPKGSDAVIMLEYTKATNGKIEVLAALAPGKNISKKGEDVYKGNVVVASGTRLRAHHVSLLAALGLSEVDVAEKPKIAILSTGNELVELGNNPRPNQIINSNRFMISSLIAELGGDPLNLGIAKDNQDEISAKITQGLNKADMVITTGGTSVGAHDLVTITINKLGKPGVLVHGVALRPGMPTGLAVLEGKPILILSGYPVAATIGFEVFARPVLHKLLGLENEPRSMLKAKLIERVVGSLGRRVYLRVNVFFRDGDFLVAPISTQGSGLLTPMTKANGYVIVPENREGLDEGEIVLAHLFAPIGGVKDV